jgi:hypothetical protein
MSFVIQPHEVNDIESQASIYIDACFILSYLDATDTRSDDVAVALDSK